MKASGLPWWHSGSESACQFRGDGFNPWPRKIPHAAEQRSPYDTTTEPGFCNERGHCKEDPVHLT